MFQPDNFHIIDHAPEPNEIVSTVRYWDKAGTPGKGAYTAGCKMSKLRTGKYLVHDVRHKQWATHERERVMRHTAEADGQKVIIHIEQEPGSSGVDSKLMSITNLAGFSVHVEPPHGDKIFRADPWSVQVNNGNAFLLRGDWNSSYISEHRFFPFGRFKDQVDASSGAFGKLAMKKAAGSVLKSRRKKR
jgi:predicted phage terminase large subunit-like protein